MKKLIGLVYLLAVLAIAGCNKGPKEASDTEAKQSMDATMNMEMPAEVGTSSTDAPAADAAPAAAP